MVVTDSFRLVVDAARCDGHGICALRCPELITLDRWGYAGVDPGAIAKGRVLRRARHAAAACPEQAITLVPTATDSSELPRQSGFVALADRRARSLEIRSRFSVDT
jgi:ferredoxin